MSCFQRRSHSLKGDFEAVVGVDVSPCFRELFEVGLVGSKPTFPEVNLILHTRDVCRESGYRVLHHFVHHWPADLIIPHGLALHPHDGHKFSPLLDQLANFQIPPVFAVGTAEPRLSECVSHLVEACKVP